MTEGAQASFIPKKALEEGGEKKRSSVNLFALLSLVLFVVSLALAGGVFLYERFLTSNIVRKQSSLERAQGAFELDLIQELSRLDRKMESSTEVLANHRASSGLFELLEELTLQSVRFDSLEYKTVAGVIDITMRGEATSFSSVALQSDVFGKNRYIREPIFSNLSLDRSGNVIFDFAATIDPSLVSYESRVESGLGIFQPKTLNTDQ